MLAGWVSNSMPRLSEMFSGLKVPEFSLLARLLKNPSTSFSFSSGLTMVQSLTAFLFLSSKSSGSPLISSSQGTSTTSFFSWVRLSCTIALTKGCFLACMLRSQVCSQYWFRLICFPSLSNRQESTVSLNSRLLMTQQLFLPQLAITILSRSYSSTNCRFSSREQLQLSLQTRLMMSSTLSERTILTAGSIRQKSPLSRFMKLVEQPRKRQTLAPYRNWRFWGSKYLRERPISVYSSWWKKLRTMLLKNWYTTADRFLSDDSRSIMGTCLTSFRLTSKLWFSWATLAETSCLRASWVGRLLKRVRPLTTNDPTALRMAGLPSSMLRKRLPFSRGTSGVVLMAKMEMVLEGSQPMRKRLEPRVVVRHLLRQLLLLRLGRLCS